MKKLFRKLFGSNGGDTVEPRIEYVDPSTIHATMPTVAADQLEFVMPTPDSFEGAPQFHEDEWRQVEFFRREDLEPMKAVLTEYSAFEAAHREKYGWRRAFARQLPVHEVLPFQATDLAALVAGKIVGAPILFITSQALGQVKGAFGVLLAENVFLYGLEDRGCITVLGAILQGGDDYVLTQAFVKLNKVHSLFLVDWRGQNLLQEVARDGSIVAWRPAHAA